MDTETIRKLIERRRRELAEFDALPAKEKERRTEEGRNPYEPPEIRAAKQAKIRAEVRAHLEKNLAGLTIEEREAVFADLGLLDPDPERINRRITGSFIKTK